MLLKGVFASIRERRRRSGEQSCEEGARIMNRLHELLAVPMPTPKVEAPPLNTSGENGPACPSPN
jgi:hypothetical protein